MLTHPYFFASNVEMPLTCDLMLVIVIVIMTVVRCNDNQQDDDYDTVDDLYKDKDGDWSKDDKLTVTIIDPVYEITML